MTYARTLVTAALALLLTDGSARAFEALPTIRVNYADLDLSRPENKLVLQQRLRRAARQVCTRIYTSTRPPGAYGQHAYCVRTTSARAQADMTKILKSAPRAELQAMPASTPSPVLR